MENRITISICGTEYTLMAEESPSYMQKVAAMVDAKMSEIMASGRVSRVDAAVLAAMNIADDMLKQQGSTENLRSQLKGYLDDANTTESMTYDKMTFINNTGKGYLDDANRAKNELSEAKREIFKLQQQLAGRK